MSTVLVISNRAIYTILSNPRTIWCDRRLTAMWSETPMTGYTASGIEKMQSLVLAVPDQTFSQDQQGAPAIPLLLPGSIPHKRSYV